MCTCVRLCFSTYAISALLTWTQSTLTTSASEGSSAVALLARSESSREKTRVCRLPSNTFAKTRVCAILFFFRHHIPIPLTETVVRSESVRNIIRERRMLENMAHPFLCNLRYSFQDVEYMYLVVDLMTGGDLRFHISRKTFTEDAVRFWIAELGCALKYVHGQGIIHRDVKPDNVLLDADGHVHLTDFVRCVLLSYSSFFFCP